jgi:hypothetical protein
MVLFAKQEIPTSIDVQAEVEAQTCRLHWLG